MTRIHVREGIVGEEQYHTRLIGVKRWCERNESVLDKRG